MIRFMKEHPWASDAVFTDVTITLDWLGRLRCLWHGTLHIRVEVATEHAVGRTESGETRVTVPPIFPRRTPASVEWVAPTEKRSD